MTRTLTRDEFLAHIPGAAGSFLDFLGFDVARLDRGRVELAVSVQPAHRNTGGVLHGGAAMGLLDVAGALAVVDDIESEFGLTLSQATRFAAPALADSLLVRARRVGGGRSIRFAEGSVHAADETTPLVVASGTYKVVPRARP